MKRHTMHETYENSNVYVKVNHAPNIKILESIEIIHLGGIIPRKTEIGSIELQKLMEILSDYEYNGAFIWRKE